MPVCSTQCASEISVNLLAQKLPIDVDEIEVSISSMFTSSFFVCIFQHILFGAILTKKWQLAQELSLNN
jgi:hypothetical protein